MECIEDQSFADVCLSVGVAGGSALVSAAPGHGQEVVVVAGVIEVCVCRLSSFIVFSCCMSCLCRGCLLSRVRLA